jgi:sec-independent protein translocase protein TatA
MFEGLLQPMHLLVILGIAMLVFGPKKLPELGKGLGEAIRGFKDSMKSEDPHPSSQVGSEGTLPEHRGGVLDDRTHPRPDV